MTYANFFRATAMALALTCGAAFAATTITTPGNIMDLGSGWRTTSVVKPLALEGNNELGTDGYYVPFGAGPCYVGYLSIPSYLTLPMCLPAGVGEYSGNPGYYSIDDPTKVPTPGPPTKVVTGNLNRTNTGVLFQFTLTGTVPTIIRVGIMVDNLDGIGFNGSSQQLICIAPCSINGPTVATTSTGPSSFNDQIPDWIFFDITNGVAGQTYQIIGALQSPPMPDSFRATLGAVSFDSLTPITAPCASISAVVGNAITPATLTASGGVGGPYTFSATGLPANLSISTSGTISGTPTTAGTYPYTVTITDSGGHTGTANCSVTVLSAPTTGCPSISAVVGNAITPVTLTGSGGVGGPYTFSATGLPANLVLSSSGTLSGTPTTAGTYPYTITITDSSGNTGTVDCSVTVLPAPTAGCAAIFSVAGTPITPVTLIASGGTGGPYTFSATGLPANLVISSGGTISGTANTAGTYHYVVTITDKDGNTGTIHCSVLVIPADAAQISYAANLKAGDSKIDLTNAGTLGGIDPTDDICANVYVFAQDQQLIDCCTCQLTPNDLQTLSAQSDLISNNLTPGVPNGITTILLASTGVCDAASVVPANLIGGLRAWSTTLHAAPGGVYAVTEDPFLDVVISPSELTKMTQLCGFIEANGSGFGICNSCKSGAAGGAKK
jgi:hypothetical protein